MEPPSIIYNSQVEVTRFRKRMKAAKEMVNHLTKKILEVQQEDLRLVQSLGFTTVCEAQSYIELAGQIDQL
jgi:hypothetical protein